jgi:hypothetical protein
MNKLICFFCFVFVVSCKDKETVPSSGIPESVSLYKLDENSTLFTSEQLRVFNIFKTSKAFNLGVTATANWGTIGRTPNQYFTVSGKFPENLEVTLPTGTYKRVDETGQVSASSDLLKDLYGKEVKFSIKDGAQSKDYTMYVPKILTVKKLGAIL